MAALVERGVRTLCFAKSRKAACPPLHGSAPRRLDQAVALSRRLHARAAAGNRAPAGRGRLARRQRHERARARDRRRPARLRDLCRLSRNRGKSAPAGPCRADGKWARRPGRLRGRPRPVLHARARSAARAPRRGGDSRLRQPACSTVTSAQPRSRRCSTRSTRRRLGLPRSSGRRSSPTCDTPRAATCGRDATTRRDASACGRAVPSRSASSTHDRVAARPGRARACLLTVHGGAVYLHLGESYRVLDLDLEGRAALVESFAGDEYTQAKKDTMTAILETARTERRLGVEPSERSP